MTRDQERARHAYACVAQVDKQHRDDYKVAVNALAAHVMRSGLAASLAFLERKNAPDGARLLLDHLGAARIPKLEGGHQQVAAQARQLGLEDYMLATREVLKVAVWLKRAVQATFEPESGRHA
jgi:CRISPR-associated protein Cmr5